ncbi:DNA polymerase III subunit chi [Novosphingopyxis sp.]|uniref:DNA polymerase III subunit chi n=1 Tax=Novosphingopyxis sp. TaxID=2709690 RepID=UPI003B5BF559
MPQVDFYQLTRDPASAILPALAGKSLAEGHRMHIAHASEDARAALSEALWSAAPESFLAHGQAGQCDEARQPILLSALATGGNGAQYCAIADGDWRDDVDGYDRIFFLFEPDKVEAARTVWKALSAKDGWQCHYWKQDGGRWARAA